MNLTASEELALYAKYKPELRKLVWKRVKKYPSEHVKGIIEDLFSEADVAFIHNLRMDRVKSEDDMWKCLSAVEVAIYKYVIKSYDIPPSHHVFTGYVPFEFEELDEQVIWDMNDPVEMVAIINAVTNDLPFQYREYAKYLLDGFSVRSYGEMNDLPYATISHWKKGLQQYYMDNGYVPKAVKLKKLKPRWHDGLQT